MFLRQIKKVMCGESMSLSRIGAVNRLLFSRNASGSISLVEKWRSKFVEEEVPEVESSINNILAHVLNLKRLDELKTKQWKLTSAQIQRFEELCECRMARMPIQYIIGEWDFRDLTLEMKPPVFIPRPETEELVELILQQFDSKRAMRFLEIGCGSGAISLALLKSLPKAICVAFDQSQLACDLTMSNAKRHNLDSRITVYREKITKDSKLDQVEGSLDLIVSNPPYVPNTDLVRVEPEIKLYEDLRALDGGLNGMEVIEAVLVVASKRLRLKGVLWLEVDPTHPFRIQKHLENHPELQLKFVASYSDMYKKDRFVEIIKV